MSKPLLSVCIITYNHQAFIREAIEGVLKQKMDFPIEIIIADDCSTDGTREILLAYKEKYPTLIKLILQQKNVGAAQNWIDLITAPKSKYIAYFEGDDYWTDPLKLQKQVDFLENNIGYSMVCHDALVVNEIDNSSRLFYGSAKNRNTFSTADVLNIHFCPTASILYRNLPKSLLAQLPREDGAGDQMLIQLISLTGLIYRMNDVMSVYRIHPYGASQVSTERLIENLDNRKINLLILNKISANKFKKNIRMEILLINSRVRFLKNPSVINSKLFLFSRVLGKIVRKSLIKYNTKIRKNSMFVNKKLLNK